MRYFQGRGTSARSFFLIKLSVFLDVSIAYIVKNSKTCYSKVVIAAFKRFFLM